MSYAPTSKIVTPPTPGLSGTALSVEKDTAPRFPSPRAFTAIVFEADVVPVTGVSMEPVKVISIVGDTLGLVRGSPAIDIKAGMLIAATPGPTVYEQGAPVTLRGHFSKSDPPYLVHVRQPDGSAVVYGAAQGVTHDGAGNTAYQFEPMQGGLWGERWESASGMLDDNTFFVAFTDVL